ncbi:SPOR domain-containing protein [Brumimicrobium oceani]|uniref:SPOR domain-containing protein n=1 Tax=Brumimicrobium oceani TaxID=2100725 RepID=A0A2U2XEP9_9FLAO|nr:SPOR domain-containing protein [Brumimicrobium oceani]PWH86265.1 hypothetical protein DIT68_03230 [Brumimicrobium oceani]
MDKYIKELLLLHSKIILPKFGAIVITNEETGELSFNEYLSYDDGKLSSLLEKESNMDLQEAQNSVAKYVRDLEQQLNKGETYSIFQLGEFSKDDSGSFIFEGNVKTGGKSGADVSSGPSPTPKTEKKEETKEEEKTILPKPEAEKVEANSSEKKNILPKPEKREPEKPIEEETAVPKPKPTTKPKTTEKTEGKKNIYVEKDAIEKTTPQPAAQQQTVVVEKEKKRRKGFIFWFLLVLLLFIVTGTALIFTNQEKVEEYMGWTIFDKKKTDKEAIEIEPQPQEKEEASVESKEEEIPVKEENLEEETSVEKEKEETVGSVKSPRNIPLSTSSGNHHVIVGCFGEKSNADKQVESFKEKGYDSRILYKSGGLYFVAAQSYPTYTAANSALSAIKQDADGAWIYKK